MSYTYKVKQGDTLNAVAQAHGFANYKDAGISSVPSGNFDMIRPDEEITLGNYDPNKVTTVPTKTSPIISSTDNQQQFRNDSTSIDTLIGSLNTKVDPVTGQKTDVKETTTTDTKTGLPKTETTAETTTGNAIFDNLQKEAKVKSDALLAKQEEDKVSYNNLWNTSLANLNATTQNAINTINTTYDKRIKEQQRINTLNIARVQAYGLGNGGQYTPIAFSDAVTDRELEASDNISALESQRNDLINKAKFARDEGETALMRKNLEDLQKIDDNINKQLKDVMAIAEKNYKNLRDARLDAEKQHKAKVAEALTSLTALSGSMADAYGTMDDKGKDETIKKIMQQTGLDYGQVYSTLEGAVAKKAKTARDIRKEEATVNATEALANQRNQPKKTSKPKAEPKLKAEQVLGTAMTEFKTKMQQKGWKGVSKSDYDVWYNYINTEYGQASANKLQKYLDDEGLSVDTQ